MILVGSYEFDFMIKMRIRTKQLLDFGQLHAKR